MDLFLEFSKWGNDLSGSSSLSPTAQWFHAVATHDGSYRRIFVNGTQITLAISVGHNVTSSLLQVGATNSNGSEPLQGNLGQVLVYNRALSSTEIQQNYSSTRSRYGV